MAALLLLYPSAARAAPVKGEVSVSTKDGYARIVFTLSEETDADVRLSNGILIIAFKHPVDIPVARIPDSAASYIGAARRDPDGAAVRIALNRKVTVNTMAAGEKLFVDLLPEGWRGLPPSLPQEVVEELARRARDAEKRVRHQLVTQQQRALPPVRVRVGIQPTFTRYTFALPGLIGVSTKRADDQIDFTFDAPIKFDLSDVQAALPPTEIEAEYLGESADAVKEQARQFASEQVSRATTVAESAISAAATEARNQGLTVEGAKSAAGEISEKIGRVASAAQKSASERVGTG
jgi:hypothetical protein